MESPAFDRPATPETGDEHFTDKERAELHLQRSKYLLEERGKDPLTDVSTRFVFDRELDRALRFIRGEVGADKRVAEKIEELSVMFLDLDNFGGVNKTLGHLAGDEVLKQTANVLSNSVRETDVVARFGGDEFYVLLPRTNEVAAEAIANKILSNLKDDQKLSELNIGASIGISSTRVTTDATELVHLANLAANQAKNSGKNNVMVAEKAGKP